jgi:hypothetical protein
MAGLNHGSCMFQLQGASCNLKSESSREECKWDFVNASSCSIFSVNRRPRVDTTCLFGLAGHGVI